jgi:hypothetical protein
MEKHFDIIEVLNPVAPSRTAEIRIGSKVDSIEGKRIGLFWNRKPNGDLVLSRIGDLLKNRYPDIEVGWLEGKNDPAQSAPEATLKEAGEKSDFVVLATAD